MALVLMWFLKGKPTAIKVCALVSSVSGGYQQTSFRFNVSADVETTKDGKLWVALAIPWAPHKTNGGFTMCETNTLALLEENTNNREEVTMLNSDSVVIWERLRGLKSNPDAELMQTQELINWYLDDIGVITFWIQPDTTYQINYQHKIAADSCLFLPTRLPVVVSSRRPKMDYKLWVINGKCLDMEKQLIKESFDRSLKNLLSESQESLDLFRFGEWGWEDDTHVHTENWESSDDESEYTA